MKTTLKEAKIKLAAIGFDIRKVDDEYHVRIHGDKWDSPRVNYTNDIHDAISTAQVERERMTSANRLKAAQVDKGVVNDYLTLERRAAMRNAIRVLREHGKRTDSRLSMDDASTLESWLSELTREAR